MGPPFPFSPSAPPKGYLSVALSQDATLTSTLNLWISNRPSLSGVAKRGDLPSLGSSVLCPPVALTFPPQV
jgi:hypothetical protein